MIRLFFLLVLALFAGGSGRTRARARVALWLIQLAARVDVQVVVYAAQAVSMAAELKAVESFLKDIEPSERPKWQGRSTLN